MTSVHWDIKLRVRFCPTKITFVFWDDCLNVSWTLWYTEAEYGGDRRIRTNIDIRTSCWVRSAGTRSKSGGVTKLYSEQVSSIARREALQQALDYIREDDVFIVTKLDRLARSDADLLTIQEFLERKGASLRVLSLGLDTTTPTGKLMLNLLGSIAQFERELMLERQREGIAKAKADGKYRGRAPTAKAQTEAVMKLYGQGIGPAGIARTLKLGRSSVYRILAATHTTTSNASA